MGDVDPEILVCRQIQNLVVSVEQPSDVLKMLVERGEARAPHRAWTQLVPSDDALQETEKHLHAWLEDRLLAMRNDSKCSAISMCPLTTNKTQAAVAMSLFENCEDDADRLFRNRVSCADINAVGAWRCICSCFDAGERARPNPRTNKSAAVFMEMGFVIWGTVAKMVFRYLEKAPPELLRGKCERRVFVSQIHELVFLGMADRTGWTPAQPTRKIKRR